MISSSFKTTEGVQGNPEYVPPMPETVAPSPQESHESNESTHETLPEQTHERAEPKKAEAVEGLKRRLWRSKKRKPTQIPQVRDALAIQIEKIMEAGLSDAFRELTPIQKQEFKIKGEETALEIRSLLRSTQVKVKKIFELLLDWLQLLPGINVFFLEQEAKIKADKILALKRMDDAFV